MEKDIPALQKLCCVKCQEQKLVYEFYKNRRQWCKECEMKYQKKYRRAKYGYADVDWKKKRIFTT